MFSQYILIVIWLGVAALIQGYFYREEYNNLTNDYEWRVRPVFAFVVMLPIVLMVANRGGFVDSSLYIRTYKKMPTSFSDIPAYAVTLIKDRGYYIASSVMHVIYGDSIVLFFGTWAVIQSVFLASFYRRYTTDFVFSIFLFIASTDYISWMFNGLRQFVAVTIILFVTPWILERRYIRVLIAIIIASLFHQTALIMIPFIIVAYGKAWNKKTLIFILCTLAAVVFINQFTDFLDDSLQATQYHNVVSDFRKQNDNGTNPIRVIVYSLPAILSFFYRYAIRDEEDPIISFSTNMSIIAAGLYVLSMYTSGIYIGRLPIYMSLYSYILLQWEIKNCFKSNYKLAKIIVVLCYLVFYFAIMHYQFDLL